MLLSVPLPFVRERQYSQKTFRAICAPVWGSAQAHRFRPPRPAIAPGIGLKEAKEQMISNFEKDYLVGLLNQYHMNISKVAREAGIDRRHVYRSDEEVWHR